jgi:hypothetical protein
MAAKALILLILTHDEKKYPILASGKTPCAGPVGEIRVVGKSENQSSMLCELFWSELL